MQRILCAVVCAAFCLPVLLAAPRAAVAAPQHARTIFMPRDNSDFSSARRHKRHKRHQHYVRRRSHHHHHHRLARKGHAGISLAGFPAPLVAKTREIQRACGSVILSGLRMHARIAGSGHVSNHAMRKAVDIAGNPRCIYAHLKGWRGGYSTDYAAMRHVHISYNRGREWGLRFVHGGRRTRHARVHRRFYGG
jgi:hypothetical protein